tara:strand:- start:165 stop:299 length:135 start_codon:yes stop_codon:yes gene_type:complete
MRSERRRKAGSKGVGVLFEFAGIAGIAGIDPQFNQKFYGKEIVW